MAELDDELAVLRGRERPAFEVHSATASAVSRLGVSASSRFVTADQRQSTVARRAGLATTRLGSPRA